MANAKEELYALIDQVTTSTNNPMVLFAYSEAMAKGLRECFPGYEVKMVEPNFKPKEDLSEIFKRNYLGFFITKEYCPRCNAEIPDYRLNRPTITCQNCGYKIRENQ